MRVVRCDGPGCDAEKQDRGYLSDWHVVESNEDADHGQFCTWTCLAAWATNMAVSRETGLTEEAG